MKSSKTREELIKLYINSLEEGIIPWEKMWETSEPRNAVTGESYKGINNLYLSYIAYKRGYKDNRWCTYLQKKNNNWKFKGNVEGQGINIEFWKVYCKSEKKNYNRIEYERIIKKHPERKDDFYLYSVNYIVFNGDLIEGLPELKIDSKEIVSNEYINNIIDNLGVKYDEYGNEAYYNYNEDKVVLPPRKNFKNDYAYYSTQLHELAHASGHISRLNRNLQTKDREEYAKEELKAEISSSFFMQKLNLEYDENHLINHKSYIQSWLKILKDKPSELFKAISDANKIVNYLEDKSFIKSKNKINNEEFLNNKNNIEKEEELYEK